MVACSSVVRPHSLCSPGRGLIFLCLVAGALSLRADTVNFNSYVSSTDNELANLFSLPGTLTQSPSDGIGGGAVLASGFPETPMYKRSFDPVNGLTTSVFVRYDFANMGEPGEGAYSVRLGFGGSTTEGLSVASPLSYFWGEFNNDGNLAIWSQGSGNGSGFNLIGTTPLATPGNWLKLTFSEVYLGGSQFQLSTRLESYGALGLEAPTVLGTGTIIVANTAAAADSSVFAGFGGYYHVAAFDDFEVLQAVPEPGAWQLLACSGAVLACAKFGRSALRRRRK